MNKSKWFYFAQLIVVVLTFVFQIILLIQLSYTPQLGNNIYGGIISYLLTNGCVVGGYILDLIGCFDGSFHDKRDKNFILITLFVEAISVVFDISAIFGISIFEIKDAKNLQLIIPIISIVGIGLYVAYIIYFFVSSLKKEDTKI